MENKTQEEIRNHLLVLAKYLFETDAMSESDTEMFAFALNSASRATVARIRHSHDDGLCLDCLSVMAEELLSLIVAK